MTVTFDPVQLCRFRRLSERWFTEFPWPEAERIAQFVNNGEMIKYADTTIYDHNTHIHTHTYTTYKF